MKKSATVIVKSLMVSLFRVPVYIGFDKTPYVKVVYPCDQDRFLNADTTTATVKFSPEITRGEREKP